MSMVKRVPLLLKMEASELINAASITASMRPRRPAEGRHNEVGREAGPSSLELSISQVTQMELVRIHNKASAVGSKGLRISSAIKSGETRPPLNPTAPYHSA